VKVNVLHKWLCEFQSTGLKKETYSL